MVPCNKNDSNTVNADDGLLYGVSLVLNFNTKESEPTHYDVDIEFVKDENHRMTWGQEHQRMKLKIFIDTNVEAFNQLLSQTSIADAIRKQRETYYGIDANTRSSCCVTLGIALLSYDNFIPAMRKSLSHFFNHTSSSSSSYTCNGTATPLATILECFRSKDASTSILYSMLNPYLDYGCNSIMSGKMLMSNQQQMFETSAIESLVESIPPIPLALLFITALLEQKIIFTSRRRSSLVSMIVALKKLLQPFEWSHLFVPLVPEGLASDLVQYPAPFILGIPFSSDTLSLLRCIPNDVTIVDVDVGRVILSKYFSVDLEGQSKEDKQSTTAALRSQVLHLAETLGGVIGEKISDRLWSCDSPDIDSLFVAPKTESKGEAFKLVISSFLRELLAGKKFLFICLDVAAFFSILMQLNSHFYF